MKIAQVGPGIMSIPPNGWGAVEMLIWDYYQILTDQGHDVVIVNTPHREEIVNILGHGNFDAIHIHYDLFHDIFPLIDHDCLLVSSHYPYLNTPSEWFKDKYSPVMDSFCQNDHFYIFASSLNDINTFEKNGANPNKIFLNRIGIMPESYSFLDKPQYDRTVCFSQIVDRKRQYLIQDFDDIDFIGRLEIGKFINKKNYRGQFPRILLNKELTKYANFCLLSEVENTTPLAVKEALCSGLGVVVSECVAVELDKRPYITVVPENLISRTEYLQDVIIENRRVSKHYRNEIREYAIDKFDLHNILSEEYVPTVESLYS